MDSVNNSINNKKTFFQRLKDFLSWIGKQISLLSSFIGGSFMPFATTAVLMVIFFTVIFFFYKKKFIGDEHNLRIPIVLLVSLTSYVIGSLVGFLFGIPRTLQAAANATTAKNTSLEQISDWLTKIIVGVGLTQMPTIRDNFNIISENVGRAILPNNGLSDEQVVIGGAVILFNSVTGFLGTYLWTRLFLDRIEHADVEAVIKTKDDEDRNARDLTLRQLRLGDVGTINLLNAYKNASGNAIANVYLLAESEIKSFPEYKDPVKIGFTIPVFEALILLDEKLDYPENYVQLGMALSMKVPPDNSNAILKFNKAIEAYRGKKPTPRLGFILYQRARCRILVSNDNPNVDTKNLIINDLKEAANEEYIMNLILTDPLVQKFIPELDLPVAS